MIFKDRREAGEKLAVKLSSYQDRRDTVVLGIPRGGVVVAAEVARFLRAPLDVIVTRKLGAPGHEELALGAIDSGGNVFLREDLVGRLGVGEEDLERIKLREQKEAQRREKAFREGRAPLELKDKVAILVDDGIATGATTVAAARAVRSRGPKKIILAVPVAPPDSLELLRPEVDELIVLSTPTFFAAVGQFYVEFDQVSDEEVKLLLRKSEGSSLGQGA